MKNISNGIMRRSLQKTPPSYEDVQNGGEGDIINISTENLEKNEISVTLNFSMDKCINIYVSSRRNKDTIKNFKEVWNIVTAYYKLQK